MANTHIIVSFLGALVGVLGISIAIWLQMIARRRTPAKYTLAFFAFGSLFLALNTRVFQVPERPASTIAGVALLLTLVVEVYAAAWVYGHYSSDAHSPEGMERYRELTK